MAAAKQEVALKYPLGEPEAACVIYRPHVAVFIESLEYWVVLDHTHCSGGRTPK